MNHERSTLLVVDDDATFRERLALALRRRGEQTLTAEGYDDALARLSEAEVDRAVVDLKLETRSGLDVVKALVAARPGIRIVVLTGYGSIATALQALRLGAVGYLTKPADAGEILAAFDPPPPGEETAEDDIEAPSLARVEWEHIQRVLADCQGNISKAARVLGLHRRSLQRKLGKYPVSR